MLIKAVAVVVLAIWMARSRTLLATVAWPDHRRRHRQRASTASPMARWSISPSHVGRGNPPPGTFNLAMWPSPPGWRRHCIPSRGTRRQRPIRRYSPLVRPPPTLGDPNSNRNSAMRTKHRRLIVEASISSDRAVARTALERDRPGAAQDGSRPSWPAMMTMTTKPSRKDHQGIEGYWRHQHGEPGHQLPRALAAGGAPQA